ncbi:MAG: S-layer homology domain-containing protein, partial [Eubacteriales bacterium]
MKKLISLILSLILILSNFTMFEIYGIDTNDDQNSYSNGSGTIDDPYLVSSIDDLKEVGENLDKHFKQTQNIDLLSIDDWTPIGTSDNPFTGTYDGGGFNIRNLKIASDKDGSGLFGYISTDSAIKNINLVEPNIDLSIRFVGSLVGYSNGGIIENCSTINGSISADEYVGGLVGVAKSSLITNSFFDGDVEAKFTDESRVGGLVGYTNIIDDNTKSTIIEECFADSTTTGGQFSGGLIGDSNSGIVKNSFSSGIVNGSSNTGGLIGNFEHLPEFDSKIANCYSTSSVDSNEYTPYGGLIGNSNEESELVTSSYWSEEISEVDKSDGGSNLETSDMKNKEKYAGWSFESIWAIDDNTNTGYPYLVNLPKQKLRISGDFSVEDKEYDSTSEVALSSENLTLSGIFIDKDSNSVKLNPVASFSDSEIGKNKIVDLSNSYLTGEYSFLYGIDFEDSPTASANIYGLADYTKTYYVEPLDEGEYYIYSTSTGSGLVGKTITASAIKIDGFTFNEENSITSGSIDAEGSLELKLYYDRNIYTVTFEDFDGSIIDTQQVKYGGDSSAPSIVNREGYDFLKWNTNFTDVKNNLTVSALWSAQSGVNYKVNHYTENLDGNYILDRTETHSGTTNTTVSALALTLKGFILNEGESITSGKIAADGSLELKLYYDRDLYTVTFVDHDSSIIDTQKVKYEGNAVLPENPYRSGYRFTGWDGSYENITKDTVIITEYIKRKSKSPLKNTTDEEKRDEVLKIEVPSVDGHWSEEAVEELVSRKIIINYETFQPEESITRIEFADYIIRALDLYKENNPYKINFTDISNDHILSDSLKSALEHGIIKGYEDKTFRPEKTISRQEAMVMYARAMK